MRACLHRATRCRAASAYQAHRANRRTPAHRSSRMIRRERRRARSTATRQRSRGRVIVTASRGSCRRTAPPCSAGENHGLRALVRPRPASPTQCRAASAYQARRRGPLPGDCQVPACGSRRASPQQGSGNRTTVTRFPGLRSRGRKLMCLLLVLRGPSPGGTSTCGATRVKSTFTESVLFCRNQTRVEIELKAPTRARPLSRRAATSRTGSDAAGCGRSVHQLRPVRTELIRRDSGMKTAGSGIAIVKLCAGNCCRYAVPRRVTPNERIFRYRFVRWRPSALAASGMRH
jgi:hypothetical protein